MIKDANTLIEVPVHVLYKIEIVDRGEHGTCLLCGSSGWTDDQQQIHHKQGCKVAAIIGERKD